MELADSDADVGNGGDVGDVDNVDEVWGAVVDDAIDAAVADGCGACCCGGGGGCGGKNCNFCICSNSMCARS